jgi:hypothetical protein
MVGEPLLRPQFAHKVVYYAAKKGFWIYIGTDGRLLRPDVAIAWGMLALRPSIWPLTPGMKNPAFLRLSHR